jgi:CheY-like chemotaxis protein
MAKVADILIIDDDDMMVEIMADVLADQGHEVRSASDGRAGIAEALRLCPDLIILDMNMPGLTGYQVAARIKADPATRHVPIIAATGYDDAESCEAAYKAGCSRFLPKPLDAGQLIDLVEEILK